ncbi:hypothetical protein ACLBSL_33675, partial [Klebsiella pneumoniae]
RRRNNTRETTAQDVVDEDLWSPAWFDGALYVSSATAVYTLVGGHLKEVDLGDEPPQRCSHLSAADGVLWSIAAKD